MMRKKNLDYLLDKVFWTFLEWLPLFMLFFCLMFSHMQYREALIKDDITFGSVSYFEILEPNITYITDLIPFNNELYYNFTNFLNDYVFTDGEFTVFVGFLAKFLMWYLAILITHVCFDALAFIPRFAHKLLDKVEV